MELYGPREVIIPHSRTILSWSRRCYTFSSRRSLLKLTLFVKCTKFLKRHISVLYSVSFCLFLLLQIVVLALLRLPILYRNEDGTNIPIILLTFKGLKSFARYHTPR